VIPNPKSCHKEDCLGCLLGQSLISCIRRFGFLPKIVKVSLSDKPLHLGHAFSRSAEMLTSGAHPLGLRTGRDLAHSERSK
jgi:hypothetical protein